MIKEILCKKKKKLKIKMINKKNKEIKMNYLKLEKDLDMLMF